MKQISLIIAAHPDDEVLGCGGTIARHISEGDNVAVLFLSDGVSSREKPNQSIEERNKSAFEACKILGADTPLFLNFPDNKMDALPLLEIVLALEKIINKIKPEVIYTHHAGDLNIDHRITHNAVMTACRPQPDFFVKKILSFEILSATEWNSSGFGRQFAPNYFVNITKQFNIKIDALRAYDTEMRPYPHSRSYEAVEALAKYRGASVGFNFAEAFYAQRILI